MEFRLAYTARFCLKKKNLTIGNQTYIYRVLLCLFWMSWVGTSIQGCGQNFWIFWTKLRSKEELGITERRTISLITVPVRWFSDPETKQENIKLTSWTNEIITHSYYFRIFWRAHFCFVFLLLFETGSLYYEALGVFVWPLSPLWPKKNPRKIMNALHFDSDNWRTIKWKFRQKNWHNYPLYYSILSYNNIF